jgi:hypothetical protein
VDSNNKTITYQYNSLNQRTRMVADGRTIDYTYLYVTKLIDP